MVPQRGHLRRLGSQCELACQANLQVGLQPYPFLRCEVTFARLWCTPEAITYHRADDIQRAREGIPGTFARFPAR